MMRTNLPADRWTKSSYSEGGSAQCVETQGTDDNLIAVGDSKDRTRGAFVFPEAAWGSFVDSIKTSAI
jgi:hypothetical protein